MKKLIALMVLSTALTANSAEKFAEIIKGTTITLTTHCRVHVDFWQEADCKIS